MRSYIFTDDEIEGLLAWLRTGDEDDALRMTFVGIRRNFRVLMIHMELMVLVEKELRRQGRFDRRMRLPRELRERMAVAMAKIQTAMAAVQSAKVSKKARPEN
jgi:hypothetical protein